MSVKNGSPCADRGSTKRPVGTSLTNIGCYLLLPSIRGPGHHQTVSGTAGQRTYNVAHDAFRAFGASNAER